MKGFWFLQKLDLFYNSPFLIAFWDMSGSKLLNYLDSDNFIFSVFLFENRYSNSKKTKALYKWVHVICLEQLGNLILK